MARTSDTSPQFIAPDSPLDLPILFQSGLVVELEMVLDEMPGAVVLQYSVLGRSAGTATH